MVLRRLRDDETELLKDFLYEAIFIPEGMQTYLVITDFHRRMSKKGLEYGMPVSILLPPEAIWGYEKVTDKYNEKPSKSWDRIFDWMCQMYPVSTEKDIIRMIGRKPTSVG